MPLAKAVDKAVKECINEDILADFLKRQRAEVIAVSIFEYNEEVELRKLRASERRYGEKIGEKRGEKKGEARGIKLGEARGMKLGESRGIKLGEARGIKIGEARGMKLGEGNILIPLICKMLQKHYTISKIAEELGQPEEKIERLCKVAQKYAPEYDVEKICSEVMEEY